MVKSKIIILEHEDKTSKGFDYTRFKVMFEGSDETKWMSSFKKTVLEQQCVQDCKDHKNRLISVEVIEKDNPQNPDKPFYNITKFYGAVAGSMDNIPDPKLMAVKKEEPKAVETTKTNVGTDRNVTFNTSYAKDIFVALASQDHNRTRTDTDEDQMQLAIDLVKQAITAFS